MRLAIGAISFAAACMLALSPTSWAVDTGPFDMSPERSVKPLSSTTVVTPEPSAPIAGPPQSDSSPSHPAPRGNGRPILPEEQVLLEGEVDSRTWDVVLTKAQAETGATLDLGYRASLVVAPEASRLRIVINEHQIFDTPITAPGTPTNVAIPLPPGVLRQGANRFRIQVTQRHRTDCTVASTYELRTQIDGATTRLQFQSANAGQLVKIEDLSAITPDENGTTHMRIIVPALAKRAPVIPTLRFVQAAAILIGMPSQSISVAENASAPTDSDGVTALIGTAEDIKPILAALPAQAFTQPLVTFVNDPVFGPSTLVISGPRDADVNRAVEAVGALVDRPRGQARDMLDTSRWFAPNPPLLQGASRVKLSTLGIFTQEFSGRRFKTEFQLGMPSDFYSNASGEATLLLDAGYNSDVLPGSHIDIFVNGSLAATTPLSSAGGEMLRHLPMRIPMTHFRPGPNRITFEAELHTATDVECSAGPARGGNHFVLFDTSEFVVPDFARVARLPNLAALQGTGFPYNASSEPVALVLPDIEPDLVSAAATLLGRMAMSAGRLIAVDVDVPTSALRTRHAIFISPASQIAEAVSGQLDLDPRIGANWQAPQAASPASGSAPTPVAASSSTGEAVDTQETFDHWREELSNEGGGWRGNISSFQDWLQRTLDFSSVSLRFLPTRDVPYQPPRNSTVVLAQGPSVSGDKAWTLLTAPTNELVRLGADAMTAKAQWVRLDGRVATFNATTSYVQTMPIATFSFLPTQPTTFSNLRLIAANWLSENILAFSLLLLSACLLLGLMTALLLAHIGRKGRA